MTSSEPSGAAPVPWLSIVIPALNEARRIEPTLLAVAQFAITRPVVDVIVVDDGSRDATADRAREIWAGCDAGSSAWLKVVSHERRRGKGAAVRSGAASARGALLLILDADLPSPLDEIWKLHGEILGGSDIAIGSRDLATSRLDPPQPLHRRLMAAAFRELRRRWLLPHIRDTQCGFKLMRREPAGLLLARCREDGWLWDCEFLALAEQAGLRIAEVGITWCDRPGSRVRPIRDGLRSLIELRAIVRRLRH